METKYRLTRAGLEHYQKRGQVAEMDMKEKANQATFKVILDALNTERKRKEAGK